MEGSHFELADLLANDAIDVEGAVSVLDVFDLEDEEFDYIWPR